MDNTPQIYVSVDIGCRQHSVAIGLSNGDVLDEFAIFHRPEGFKQFFERIEHHRQRHGGAVAGSNGRLQWLCPPFGQSGESTRL